jgi:hypothetical protein
MLNIRKGKQANGNMDDFPNFYNYVPLEVPSRETCIRLARLLDASNEDFVRLLRVDIGESAAEILLPYSEVFWAGTEILNRP